jgi:uncharacterized protein YciI
MAYFALFYRGKEYITRRAPYRADHLKLAHAAEQAGTLLLGGAFSDADDTALLIFRAEDSKVVLDFVAADPYVANGVVESWEIRPWSVAAGCARNEK